MTVVHPHPHPLAMQVVQPSNANIFSKFGTVRVEDWDDRVSGLTWGEKCVRGTFPEADRYVHMKSVNDIAPHLPRTDVVRCHTTLTGEVVLLHNDWLPSAVTSEDTVLDDPA